MFRRFVRTLPIARHLLDLPRDRRRAALSRLLDRAEAHGLPVDVVALADTRSY